MYSPILRNRQSEVLAFEALDAEIKRNCLPLFDLAAPSKKRDQAQTEAYVLRNIKRTGKAIKGTRDALVDSSELDPGVRLGKRVHPIEEAAAEIADAGCGVIPVTGLHRDDSHNKAVRKIASQETNGICFRLDATDIGTASMTLRQMLALLSEWSISDSEVLLLLDLQSVYAMDAVALATQVNRFIEKVMQDARWRGFIVAGYGIPDQITAAVPVRAQGYIPRVEQDVYNAVAHFESSTNLWFGDYATLAPTNVELDWRLVSKVMSPKAIYALDDSWFVVRGGPFSSHKDGYRQYHDIANEIIALSEFPGSTYSYGDEYISECATNKDASSGSPSSWIKACVNHHITLTADNHR